MTQLSTRALAFLAGAVWLAAGINVCKVGIHTWMQLGSSAVTPMMIGGSALTLAAFSAMFLRLTARNLRRIRQLDAGHRRMWNMMPVRSYVIMAFMITLGITLRQSAAVPLAFIASFYSGLGSALALAGIPYFTLKK